MTKPQPIEQGNVNAFMGEMASLEVNLLDEVISSRSKAWLVAGGATVIALCSLLTTSVVVYRYAQPLPQNLLSLDSNTGAVQQVSITAQKDSYGELIDKYWLSRFVESYNSYNFYSIQQDYDTVGLMASDDVAVPYQQKFAGSDGLDKRLGDSEYTSTNVSSIILDEQNGIATVRFTTIRKRRRSDVPEPPIHWIATVSYTYDNNLMTAKQRFINPLGFRVLSYRAETEIVSGGAQ